MSANLRLVESDLDAHIAARTAGVRQLLADRDDDDNVFRLYEGADYPQSAPMPLVTDDWLLARMARKHGPRVYLWAAVALVALAIIASSVAPL